MKNTLRLYVIFPLVALLVAGSNTQLHAQIAPQYAHPADATCESCHLAGDRTTPDNAAALTARQEQLCLRCHPDSLQLGHPSGFSPQPGQKIAAAYPLDWKGVVTCSTCHEVHGNSPGKLRGALRGRDMCMACHDQDFFDRMPDSGISLLPYGHLGKLMTQGWQDLDQYSMQCMGCHGERGDKSTGEDPIVLASNQILRHGSLNHSIGRSYAEAMSFGGYRAVSALSKKILLPDGKVSCISCHEGYSKTHGKLVTAMDRSSLCFECHDL